MDNNFVVLFPQTLEGKKKVGVVMSISTIGGANTSMPDNTTALSTLAGAAFLA